MSSKAPGCRNRAFAFEQTKWDSFIGKRSLEFLPQIQIKREHAMFDKVDILFQMFDAVGQAAVYGCRSLANGL